MQKQLLLFILFVMSLGLYAQTDIQNKIIGKTYTKGDSSCVVRSFTFISNTICEYQQVFFIDIEEKYKYSKIVCKYKVEGDKIILQNIEYPDYLAGLEQFVVPNYKDSIMKYFNQNNVRCYDTTYSYTSMTIEDRPYIKECFVNSTKQMSFLYNGYVDNIKNIDTMFFINDCILYSKIIDIPYRKTGNNVYYYKFIFEDKDNSGSIKQKYKILQSKRANEFLIINGFPHEQKKMLSTLRFYRNIFCERKIMFFYKRATDKYVLKEGYKNVQQMVKKHNLDKQVQNYLFDDFICNFSGYAAKKRWFFPIEDW